MALGVFARAPIAGRTKTRLVSYLGKEGAAAFHRAALLDTLERAATIVPGTRLFLTPIAHAGVLRRLGVQCAIEAQGAGSLGTRMARALDRLLAPREVVAAALIGTDSPDLPRSYLRKALRTLEHAPSVLLPVADGGFALIGVRRDARAGGQLERILRPVRWSHSETLEHTASRLAAADLAPVILHAWFDVDVPSDVIALRERLAGSPPHGDPVPPRTAALLAKLGPPPHAHGARG